MNTLRDFGGILFAAGIAVFGVQYLLDQRFAGGLPPVPPWAPAAAETPSQAAARQQIV